MFEALAIPLLAPLYNFAHWLTHNRDEAEDLVQETYVKALKGFPSFTPGTNFRAWMYRILRNTFLTSRSGLRDVPLEDEPEIADDVTPETAFMQRFNRESLRAAIEQLPLQFREVLVLSDVENMSYKEIAETLSIPIGTVTSRLIRAREKVRVALRS